MVLPLEIDMDQSLLPTYDIFYSRLKYGPESRSICFVYSALGRSGTHVRLVGSSQPVWLMALRKAGANQLPREF